MQPELNYARRAHWSFVPFKLNVGIIVFDVDGRFDV